MLMDLNYLDNNAQIVPQQNKNVSDDKTRFGGNREVLQANPSE